MLHERRKAQRHPWRSNVRSDMVPKELWMSFMVLMASSGQCFVWMNYHILYPSTTGGIILGFKISFQQDGMMSTTTAICGKYRNSVYSAPPQFLSTRAKLASSVLSPSLLSWNLDAYFSLPITYACYWLSHIILVGLY